MILTLPNFIFSIYQRKLVFDHINFCDRQVDPSSSEALPHLEFVHSELVHFLRSACSRWPCAYCISASA